MKKCLKLLSLLLALTLVVGLTAGITVAILTDEESAVNVMTVGNVYIDQLEYERDGSGGFRDFTQNKPWLPVTEKNVQPDTQPTDWSAIGAPGSDYLMDPAVDGIQDKVVVVENTGSTDAYIRTVIAYRCPLGFDPALLNIHDNSSLITTDQLFIELDGVRYLVREYTYPDPVAPGQTTAPSLMQLWLDFDATNRDVELYGGEMDVLVVSQAVQADGFGAMTAQEALDAAFYDITATENPWNPPLITTVWSAQ